MFENGFSHKLKTVPILFIAMILSSCIKGPYVGILNYPDYSWSSQDWPITLKCWNSDPSKSLLSAKKDSGSISYEEALNIWGRMKVYGMECFVEFVDGPRGSDSDILFVVTVSYLFQGNDLTYQDYVNSGRTLFSGSASWSDSSFTYTINHSEDISLVKNYFSIGNTLDESDMPAIGDVWHFIGKAEK